MAEDGDLLKPSVWREAPGPCDIPGDPVGMRPPGDRPQGALRLVWLALVAVRYRFGRLLVHTVWAGVILVGASELVCCLLSYLGKAGAPWMTDLRIPLLWFVWVPVMAGYGYVVLLEIQDYRPRGREMLRPLRRRALYFNVFVAGLVSVAGPWALHLAARPVWAALPETLLPGQPVLKALVRQVPVTGLSLVFTPLAFAGLDALVAKRHFADAIRRSVGFAVRHGRLFAGFLVVNLVAAAPWAVATALLQWLVHGRQTEARALPLELYWLAMVFVVLYPMVWVVVYAHFYREFVWREREREAAARGPAPA